MHDASQVTSRRRISGRTQFPSWAWAGWEGHIMLIAPLLFCRVDSIYLETEAWQHTKLKDNVDGLGIEGLQSFRPRTLYLKAYIASGELLKTVSITSSAAPVKGLEAETYLSEIPGQYENNFAALDEGIRSGTFQPILLGDFHFLEEGDGLSEGERLGGDDLLPADIYLQ